MKTAPKPEEMLSPKRAAKLAGMSRQAFMLHVGVDVHPDAVSGKIKYFRPSTIERWKREREEKGVKKRGPKPQREQAAA